MKIKKISESKISFPMGQIVATPAALDALEKAGQNSAEFLDRHAKGDWGEVGEEDSKSNDEALRIGERLLSAYTLESGEKIWIITERDRSASTILLPGDY